MEKSKGLSKITLGLGIYIVISAAFMRQVWDWLSSIFGDFLMMHAFVLCFILISVFTIIYAFKIHLGLFKICAVVLLFVLAYLFARWQPYFSEKTHVLTYGLLGFLATSDLFDSKKSLLSKEMGQALFFISVISALDELFQGLLPYRVGELRDYITNVIGGIFGMGLLLVLKKRVNIS